MRNKNIITLNGKPSTEITGLLIQELPPISKPLLRTEIEEIDGRDGDIVTALGYSAYNKEITIGLYGNFDIDEIISYFNSEGTVIFSNEPDKYYNYQIIQQIDFERLVRYRTATVTFHTQPFKYAAFEGNLILDPEATNLLSIPDFTAASNGVTLSAADGVVSIIGTPTAATEFYLPISALALEAGSYDLSATASGTNPNYCSIRLIGSAPSDADSLGGKYITLAEGTVALQAALSSAKTFNYLWFYMNPGQTFDFTATFEVENRSEKVISGSGSSLVLLNTSEALFSKFNITGDTYQQANPTPDSPQAIQVVQHQDMIRLTGKNLVNVDELYLPAEVERTSDGLRETIESSTLTTYFAGSITNPVGIYTISFDARITNPDEATLILDSTADIWDSTGLALKDKDGNAADEFYRTLGEDWKRYSYTVIATTSGIWTDERAAKLHFSSYVNSPIFELRDFQIELGATATEYDISRTQMYPINFRTGKNILSEDFLIMGDMAYGTPVVSVKYRVNNAVAPLGVIPSTTYAISANLGSTVEGMMVKVCECDQNTQFLQDHEWQQLANGAYIFTTRSDTAFIKLVFGLSTTSATVTEGSTENTTEYDDPKEWLRGATIQVELGDSATAYEPYESIELCRIDGYQDYLSKSGDDWILHKEIGKLTLDGSESGWGWDATHRCANIPRTTSGFPAFAVADLGTNYLVNSFTPSSSGVASSSSGQSVFSSTQMYFLTNNASLAAFQSWAAANNIVIYAPLATPTDTQITSAETIAQLDALKNQVHAYKGITFISSIPGNSSSLPPILDVEVGESSDGVVTNAGNFPAKPKLTIYGTGDIGLSLNGNQIFQIALGNDGYITIDTAAMEAYQDNTETLKNRQVVGDYDNFMLNPGENSITFSGSVTKCIVENYSRWI